MPKIVRNVDAAPISFLNTPQLTIPAQLTDCEMGSSTPMKINGGR